MFDIQNIIRNINLSRLSLVITIFAIFFRFYHQFIDWAYNWDSVLLGNDIINHQFPDLLSPFESFQSAPPLFLILQKLISNISPHYISLKILSFLSSCLSLIFFKKLIERNEITILTICLLLIFAFNPFILYHSLTLKQYTIDLTFGLVSIYFFSKQKSFFKTYSFFTLWCLMSNVGLFFSAAYALNTLFKDFCNIKGSNFLLTLQTNLKTALPFILAPVIYILFFIWYINQPGAIETKNYMTDYWEAWFAPLNMNIFWWIAVQFYRLTYFLFSTYIAIGMVMFLGLILSIPFVFRKSNIDKEIYRFLKIYTIAICIHLILSTLRLYPFSDRLYLYIAPFVLYLSYYGLEEFFKYLRFNKIQVNLIMVLFTIILLSLNMTYINYKENDIRSLSIKLEPYKNYKLYRTSRADNLINEWVVFTKYADLSQEFLRSKNQTDLSKLKSKDLIISRVYKKFGHESRTNRIEDTLQNLLNSKKLKKIIEVDGYNVYLVLN